MFSAFLAKKNNLYIWGEINSYDSSYITYTYLVPLLNPVENKMYRDILFSKSSRLPIPPSEIESA